MSGFSLWSMGSSRPVGHWARLPTLGPPPRLSGRCAVGGRPLCSVGGLQARERGRQKFQKKAPFFPSSPLHVRGGRRKMNSVVQNDTVLLFLLFFFFNIYETASFWIKRAVSFKSGARTRQVSNQPSIIFCLFQSHPFQFPSPPL